MATYTAGLVTVLLLVEWASCGSKQNLEEQSGDVFYSNVSADVTWKFTWARNRSDVILVITALTVFAFPPGGGSVLMPDGVAVAPDIFVWGDFKAIRCGAYAKQNSACQSNGSDVALTNCDDAMNVTSLSVAWPPVINASLRRTAVFFSYRFVECQIPKQTVEIVPSSKDAERTDSDRLLVLVIACLGVLSALCLVLVIACGVKRRKEQEKFNPPSTVVEVRGTYDMAHNIYHTVENEYALADNEERAQTIGVYLTAQ